MAIEHTDNTRSLFCLKASRSWWWDDNKSTKAVNYTQRAQLRPWYTMGWRGSLYTACLLYQSVNSRPNTYPPYNNTSPIDIIARFWACGVEFLELQKELSGQKVANISLLSKFEPFFTLERMDGDSTNPLLSIGSGTVYRYCCKAKSGSSDPLRLDQ